MPPRAVPGAGTKAPLLDLMDHPSFPTGNLRKPRHLARFLEHLVLGLIPAVVSFMLFIVGSKGFHQT